MTVLSERVLRTEGGIIRGAASTDDIRHEEILPREGPGSLELLLGSQGGAELAHTAHLLDHLRWIGLEGLQESVVTHHGKLLLKHYIGLSRSVEFISRGIVL